MHSTHLTFAVEAKRLLISAVLYGGRLVPFVTVTRAAPSAEEEKRSGTRPITVRDRIFVDRRKAGDNSRGREGKGERASLWTR